MPLNFFAAFFLAVGFLTAMNSPDVLLRLVQALAPPSVVLRCDRFRTAPLRALSPTGLFTAITISRRAHDKRGCNANRGARQRFLRESPTMIAM